MKELRELIEAFQELQLQNQRQAVEAPFDHMVGYYKGKVDAYGVTVESLKGLLKRLEKLEKVKEEK